jgi:predicted transposase YbfD/YdcC
MTSAQYTSLYAALAAVPDPRHARGCRYPWPVLLLLIAAALLAGQTHVRAIARWLFWHTPEILPLLPTALTTVPSRATFYRTLRTVDLTALQQHLDRFTHVALSPPAAAAPDPRPPTRAVALDGKSVRGALAHARPCHLVSIVTHDTALVQTQAVVPAKSGEQTLAPQLLARLDLRGAVVTVDALHTHWPLAHQIRAQGGHYLMVVKDNQPALGAAIAELFADPPWGVQPSAAEYERVTTHDKGHGRVETRTLERSTALNAYLAADLGWPGVGQVLRRHCRRQEGKRGKSQEGVWYAITSLSAGEASAAQLEALWRGHWHIENKVHYVRDVTLGEDRGQAWTGNTPVALAALRNAVLNCLRAQGCRAIPDALAEYAASVPKIFALLTRPRL